VWCVCMYECMSECVSVCMYECNEYMYECVSVFHLSDSGRTCYVCVSVCMCMSV